MSRPLLFKDPVELPLPPQRAPSLLWKLLLFFLNLFLLPLSFLRSPKRTQQRHFFSTSSGLFYHFHKSIHTITSSSPTITFSSPVLSLCVHNNYVFVVTKSFIFCLHQSDFSIKYKVKTPRKLKTCQQVMTWRDDRIVIFTSNNIGFFQVTEDDLLLSNIIKLSHVAVTFTTDCDHVMAVGPSFCDSIHHFNLTIIDYDYNQKTMSTCQDLCRRSKTLVLPSKLISFQNFIVLFFSNGNSIKIEIENDLLLTHSIPVQLTSMDHLEDHVICGLQKSSNQVILFDLQSNLIVDKFDDCYEQVRVLCLPSSTVERQSILIVSDDHSPIIFDRVDESEAVKQAVSEDNFNLAYQICESFELTMLRQWVIIQEFFDLVTRHQYRNLEELISVHLSRNVDTAEIVKEINLEKFHTIDEILIFLKFLSDRLASDDDVTDSQVPFPLNQEVNLFDWVGHVITRAEIFNDLYSDDYTFETFKSFCQVSESELFSKISANFSLPSIEIFIKSFNFTTQMRKELLTSFSAHIDDVSADVFDRLLTLIDSPMNFVHDLLNSNSSQFLKKILDILPNFCKEDEQLQSKIVSLNEYFDLLPNSELFFSDFCRFSVQEKIKLAFQQQSVDFLIDYIDFDQLKSLVPSYLSQEIQSVNKEEFFEILKYFSTTKIFVHFSTEVTDLVNEILDFWSNQIDDVMIDCLITVLSKIESKRTTMLMENLSLCELFVLNNVKFSYVDILNISKRSQLIRTTLNCVDSPTVLLSWVVSLNNGRLLNIILNDLIFIFITKGWGSFLLENGKILEDALADTKTSSSCKVDILTRVHELFVTSIYELCSSTKFSLTPSQIELFSTIETDISEIFKCSNLTKESLFLSFVRSHQSDLIDWEKCQNELTLSDLRQDSTLLCSFCCHLVLKKSNRNFDRSFSNKMLKFLTDISLSITFPIIFDHFACTLLPPLLYNKKPEIFADAWEYFMTCSLSKSDDVDRCQICYVNELFWDKKGSLFEILVDSLEIITDPDLVEAIIKNFFKSHHHFQLSRDNYDLLESKLFEVSLCRFTNSELSSSKTLMEINQSSLTLIDQLSPFPSPDLANFFSDMIFSNILNSDVELMSIPQTVELSSEQIFKLFPLLNPCLIQLKILLNNQNFGSDLFTILVSTLAKYSKILSIDAYKLKKHTLTAHLTSLDYFISKFLSNFPAVVTEILEMARTFFNSLLDTKSNKSLNLFLKSNPKFSSCQLINLFQNNQISNQFRTILTSSACPCFVFASYFKPENLDSIIVDWKNNVIEDEVAVKKLVVSCYVTLELESELRVVRDFSRDQSKNLSKISSPQKNSLNSLALLALDYPNSHLFEFLKSLLHQVKNEGQNDDVSVVSVSQDHLINLLNHDVWANLIFGSEESSWLQLVDVVLNFDQSNVIPLVELMTSVTELDNAPQLPSVKILLLKCLEKLTEVDMIEFLIETVFDRLTSDDWSSVVNQITSCSKFSPSVVQFIIQFLQTSISDSDNLKISLNELELISSWAFEWDKILQNFNEFYFNALSRKFSLCELIYDLLSSFAINSDDVLELIASNPFDTVDSVEEFLMDLLETKISTGCDQLTQNFIQNLANFSFLHENLVQIARTAHYPMALRKMVFSELQNQSNSQSVLTHGDVSMIQELELLEKFDTHPLREFLLPSVVEKWASEPQIFVNLSEKLNLITSYSELSPILITYQSVFDDILDQHVEVFTKIFDVFFEIFDDPTTITDILSFQIFECGKISLPKLKELESYQKIPDEIKFFVCVFFDKVELTLAKRTELFENLFVSFLKKGFANKFCGHLFSLMLQITSKFEIFDVVIENLDRGIEKSMMVMAQKRSRSEISRNMCCVDNL
ncbi:hypothetical protein P9112_005197 [Eukaryota sp. TZLM1-RC]